jgi:hypothetical protein
MRSASDPLPAALDQTAVRAEMEQARLDFRRVAGDATAADLRRRSDGTKVCLWHAFAGVGWPGRDGRGWRLLPGPDLLSAGGRLGPGDGDSGG